MEQDWKPIVFKKKIENNNSKQNSNLTNTSLKSKVNLHLLKIDKTEIGKIKKLDHKIGKVIAQKRTQLKLSQKQLAQRINIKPEIIAQYESGKANPNQNLLMRLQKILGVNLTGKNIGSNK